MHLLVNPVIGWRFEKIVQSFVAMIGVLQNPTFRNDELSTPSRLHNHESVIHTTERTTTNELTTRCANFARKNLENIPNKLPHHQISFARNEYEVVRTANSEPRSPSLPQ